MTTEQPQYHGRFEGHRCHWHRSPNADAWVCRHCLMIERRRGAELDGIVHEEAFLDQIWAKATYPAGLNSEAARK